MSNDKLVVTDAVGPTPDWRVVWWIEETNDYGGVLGEVLYTDAQVAKASDDDRAAMVGARAAADASPERDATGYFWETKGAAQAALKAVNAAMRLVDPKHVVHKCAGVRLGFPGECGGKEDHAKLSVGRAYAMCAKHWTELHARLRGERP